MKVWTLLGGLIGLLMLSPLAQAASGRMFVFNLGLIYTDDTVSQENTSRSQTTTGTTFHAGFFIFDGLALGLAHHQMSIASTTKASQGGITFTTTETETKGGQGLYIGYYADSGFNAGLSLLFNPTRTDSDETYSGGSAYSLEFGWMWEINKSWSFGFNMMYSVFGFTKHEQDGVETDLPESRKETQLIPMGHAAISI